MTASGATANAIPSAWRTPAARLPACALFLMLSACAGGSGIPSLAPTAAAEPSTAPASPPTAAPAGQPAKPPPPQKLTATEINEACWMDPAINKVADLDKRLKLVDKCVDQKTKAQGGL